MIIRGYSNRDFNQLSKIHHEQYADEFSIDEFSTNNYLGHFSVLDDDQLISTGGVRLIPEVVVVTDKNRPVKIRREALIKVLQASGYMVGNLGHTQLHAFVQDQVWLEQLLKRGFRKTAGQSVVIDV